MPVILTLDTPDPATVTTFEWGITYPDASVVTSGSSQYIDIFSMPGTYDVTLTIDGGETQTIEDFITVHAPPVANLSADVTAGCYPLCVNFSDETTTDGGEIIEWSWDFGNGIIDSNQNPSYCYQNAGTYTPILSIEDEFGCFSAVSIPEELFVKSMIAGGVQSLNGDGTNSAIGNASLTSIKSGIETALKQPNSSSMERIGVYVPAFW